MPYLLVLILLAILGGPWLVVAALAMTGVWFAIVWIIAGIFMVLLITILIIACLPLITIKKPKRRAFGAKLDPKFKGEHEFEPGIYKEDKHFIVEINGHPTYFENIGIARLARDSGRGGAPVFSVVPVDHPSRRPRSQQ